MSAPEPSLDAVRARWPGWDIRRMLGGYVAVPAGTSVIEAMYLSSLEEKLGGRA